MSDINVKIMMFGGRRCGKTSIIAAMRKCFSTALAKSDLTISVSDPETMNLLEEKTAEIEGYFRNKHRGMTVDSSGSATSELSEYKLWLSLKTKKGRIGLNMIDYPGEWFVKRDSDYAYHQEILADKMRQSNIIMIAVDTPFLMEQNNGSDSPDDIGQYNWRRNYCDHLANMIKEHFSEKSYFPKMIMFVPLKCETYYDKGQMELVKDRIKIAYKEVFDFVSGSNQCNYEVIIAPILTFGNKTMRFSRFERDKETKEIIVDAQTGVPSQCKYLFVDMNCKYHPTFCEQPLLYSLAYMLKLYEYYKTIERSNEGFFGGLARFLKETFGNAASLDDFMAQHRFVKESLMQDPHEGYEISQDPILIGFKS